MARARAPEALTDLEQIRGDPELGTLVQMGLTLGAA
jgi:hypothetical protein